MVFLKVLLFGSRDAFDVHTTVVSQGYILIILGIPPFKTMKWGPVPIIYADGRDSASGGAQIACSYYNTLIATMAHF